MPALSYRNDVSFTASLPADYMCLCGRELLLGQDGAWRPGLCWDDASQEWQAQGARVEDIRIIAGAGIDIELRQPGVDETIDDLRGLAAFELPQVGDKTFPYLLVRDDEGEQAVAMLNPRRLLWEALGDEWLGTKPIGQLGDILISDHGDKRRLRQRALWDGAVGSLSRPSALSERALA
jgi:hypothetical protein